MVLTKRRTPEEIYAAAVAKVAKAISRNATVLNLGERRLSLLRLPPVGGLQSLRVLTLSQTGITDISGLSDVPSLQELDLSHTAISNIESLANLPRLKKVNLGFSRVSDLNPIAGLAWLEDLDISHSDVRSIAALTKLPLRRLRINGLNLENYELLREFQYLEYLQVSFSDFEDLTPVSHLKSLHSLIANDTKVRSTTPLAGLLGLENINLSDTEVSDIAALKNLNKLARLDISSSKVSDLSSLSEHTELLTSARFDFYSHYYFGVQGGLTFRGCPIADPALRAIADKRNPRRTFEALNHLRAQQGLELLDEPDGLSDDEEGAPLDNVPSPYQFSVSPDGKLTVSGAGAEPNFPHPTSARDHAQRLEACRTLAEDLLSDLNDGTYQARREYPKGIEKYLSRLPTVDGTGNILLADAEARTIRSLFAAEAETMSPAFAAKLKTFLESHIGLRVFYPQISQFYNDVQTGHIEAPLPSDAIEGFVRGVQANTPTVFDKSVSEAVGATAEAPPTIATIEKSIRITPDDSVVLPPRDPLGTVDTEKAWNFSFAGVANGLWKAFLEGSKLHGALESWRQASSDLAPYAQEIIRWLRMFLDNNK